MSSTLVPPDFIAPELSLHHLRQDKPVASPRSNATDRLSFGVRAIPTVTDLAACPNCWSMVTSSLISNGGRCPWCSCEIPARRVPSALDATA
ncbi:MAG: hypothetical protein JXB39_04425 [Deltaproteobacteria bacterium]|nr:hypothetical protein [Deltaproteobacteria bacterium]